MGVHSVFCDYTIADVSDMIETISAIAIGEGLATPGRNFVVAAGLLVGVVGSTNFLHIAKV